MLINQRVEESLLRDPTGRPTTDKTTHQHLDPQQDNDKTRTHVRRLALDWEEKGRGRGGRGGKQILV